MYASYADKLIDIGARQLAEIMQNYAAFKALAKPQPKFLTTPKSAPKISKSFAAVAFESMDRVHIFNRFRAASHLVRYFSQRSPLHEPVFNAKMDLHARLKTQFGDHELKIVRLLAPSTHSQPASMNAAQWLESTRSTGAGAVFFEKHANLLWICCGCGGWLAAATFKVVGKNHLFSAASLVHGYHLKNFQQHIV